MKMVNLDLKNVMLLLVIVIFWTIIGIFMVNYLDNNTEEIKMNRELIQLNNDGIKQNDSLNMILIKNDSIIMDKLDKLDSIQRLNK